MTHCTNVNDKYIVLPGKYKCYMTTDLDLRQRIEWNERKHEKGSEWLFNIKRNEKRYDEVIWHPPLNDGQCIGEIIQRRYKNVTYKRIEI